MERLCRVLIVDDEILARQGLKHLVNWEKEGFRIVGEASNGSEALKLIETLRPHIVLTDIVMPVMDGEEFARLAKARYPELEIIVLSSFSEFEYVRSTFQSGVADYMLKPKLEAEELLSILRRTARKIPSLQLEEPGDYRPTLAQLLEKLVDGYGADIDLTAAAEAMPHGSYRLIGADVKQLAEKESYTARIRARLEEELRERSGMLVFERVPAGPGLLTFLANGEREELDGLRTAADRLSEWSQGGELDVVWLLGEPFSNLRELGGEYRSKFAKLAEYRFFLGDRPVLACGELPEADGPEPKFDMTGFTEEMNRQRFDEAFGALRSHVRKLAARHTTDVFEFKSFLGNMIFNTTILLGNAGYDAKELEEAKYSYFKRIDDAKHAEETIELLETFLSEVSLRTASRQEPVSPNMKRLLDYIRDNYAEPLSLTGVATHFHFNPSYLSSYFASHNKEGFSEYLNKIRVEKAAELLRTEAASISEISGMVGYSDHSYFTKVFKKLTGLSPSLYRKQYGMKDREWL